MRITESRKGFSSSHAPPAVQIWLRWPRKEVNWMHNIWHGKVRKSYRLTSSIIQSTVEDVFNCHQLTQWFLLQISGDERTRMEWRHLSLQHSREHLKDDHLKFIYQIPKRNWRVWIGWRKNIPSSLLLFVFLCSGNVYLLMSRYAVQYIRFSFLSSYSCKINKQND